MIKRGLLTEYTRAYIHTRKKLAMGLIPIPKLGFGGYRGYEKMGFGYGSHTHNVGTVFAQFRHYKFTSLYKNSSMLNMRAQHHMP